MAKLLGWSRIYFHLSLIKNTFYWISRRYAPQNPRNFEILFRGAANTLDLIESIGGEIEVEGIQHLRDTKGPVVIVGNHMSTLETTLLPYIILPYKKISFVLKQSLLSMPFLKEALFIMDCIGVTRKDPVKDFKQIMDRGLNHLVHGTSIIIFPQTTRTTTFDPEQFGSAGIKLAKRANVPIIPLALKTDFLENGKFIKDFGPIHLNRKIHLRFGAPIQVQGNGKEQHQQIIDFISEALNKWQ